LIISFRRTHAGLRHASQRHAAVAMPLQAQRCRCFCYFALRFAALDTPFSH
jgi:hypothetical protein